MLHMYLCVCVYIYVCVHLHICFGGLPGIELVLSRQHSTTELNPLSFSGMDISHFEEYSLIFSRWLRHSLWGQTVLVSNHSSTTNYCETVGKSFNTLGLSFSTCKTGIIIRML